MFYENLLIVENLWVINNTFVHIRKHVLVLKNWKKTESMQNGSTEHEIEQSYMHGSQYIAISKEFQPNLSTEVHEYSKTIQNTKNIINFYISSYKRSCWLHWSLIIGWNIYDKVVVCV